MSELIVAGFKGEFTADEVLLDLLKMKQIHLIDLDYAVVAVRRDDGTITVKHSNVLVHADATAGCQWGIIIAQQLMGFRKDILRQSFHPLRINSAQGIYLQILLIMLRVQIATAPILPLHCHSCKAEVLLQWQQFHT